MTYDEQRTVYTEPERAPVAIREVGSDHLHERRTATTRPSGATLASRIVIVLFGLIQVLIGARILLLLLDAREANALVAGILDLSAPFVAPFEGMLGTNAVQAGGSVLDIAAVLALIGWTVVELIILAILRIGRSGDEV